MRHFPLEFKSAGEMRNHQRAEWEINALSRVHLHSKSTSIWRQGVGSDPLPLWPGLRLNEDGSQGSTEIWADTNSRFRNNINRKKAKQERKTYNFVGSPENENFIVKLLYRNRNEVIAWFELSIILLDAIIPRTTTTPAHTRIHFYLCIYETLMASHRTLIC